MKNTKIHSIWARKHCSALWGHIHISPEWIPSSGARVPNIWAAGIVWPPQQPRGQDMTAGLNRSGELEKKKSICQKAK